MQVSSPQFVQILLVPFLKWRILIGAICRKSNFSLKFYKWHTIALVYNVCGSTTVVIFRDFYFISRPCGYQRYTCMLSTRLWRILRSVFILIQLKRLIFRKHISNMIVRSTTSFNLTQVDFKSFTSSDLTHIFLYKLL